MYFITASAIAYGGYGFNRLDEKINQMVERISPADWSQFAFAAVTEKSSVTEISFSFISITNIMSLFFLV